MIEIGAMPAPLPDELRGALAGVSFATIGHFLETGLVDPDITALVRPAKVVGRALTVRITPPDSTAVHQITAMVEPGDVVVIETGGNKRHAAVGELVALAAKCRGAVGIVIDGVCTDIVEIRAMGFPVFARGTSLLTTKLHGLDGAINVPVTCGGVIVTPGDVVLGDDNGVLVLVPGLARSLVSKAQAAHAQEPDARAFLLAGGTLSSRFGAAPGARHPRR